MMATEREVLRFDELPLLLAVWNVRRTWMTEPDETYKTPGSDKWLYGQSFAAMCYEVTLNLPSVDDLGRYDKDDIRRMWLRFRKGQEIRKTKLDIIAQLATVEGCGCFYAVRRPDQCDELVELDRINAGGPYEVWNCVIACKHHNGSRQNKSMEDFVSHGRKLNADSSDS